MKTETIRTFSDEELKNMKTEQFDSLNVHELIMLRKTNLPEYHRLWKQSIAEAKD